MLDADGAEVVLTFAAEDWWVSDVSSFCEGTASQMFIETLEDSELLLLTPESKEAALREIPALERVFRLLLQRHLSRWQTRFYEHLAVSATERYLAFAARYPVLIQRLPQHQIAAYLGIAPESLSRLRKKISEKH
jgi:CRP-like cAMP-binding protein